MRATETLACNGCARAFSGQLVFDGPAHDDAPRGICAECQRQRQGTKSMAMKEERKAILDLETIQNKLTEIIDERQAQYDGRSERWQESESAQRHEARTEGFEAIRDAIETGLTDIEETN